MTERQSSRHPDEAKEPQTMKKAIKSKYTESVTVVERVDWSIDFYDVETGRHYTRRVWFPVHSSDIYVQHRGGFYSIATEFEGRYNPQAISKYEVVSAEELETMTAEIIAHRAGKQYAAALTWEEATRIYAYAIICNDADEYATMDDIVSGILQDRSKQPTQQATEATRAAADRATETAEANARELEQRAEIIATISDHAEREYIVNKADRYQWTPEETRDNIEYRAIIRTANRAAAALMSAYAEASGESLTEDDDETRAAYLVARDEITGTSERASAYDRAMVAGMVQTIAAAVAYMRPFAAANRAAAAFVAAYAEAIGDTIAESDPEARAAQAVARAEIAGSHASYYDRAMVRDMLEAIASKATEPEPAPVYQRYELDAYLGDPDAYDVEAIEAEATAYDPKTGARVWSAFGEDLAAIAERHELYEYAPAI